MNYGFVVLYRKIMDSSLWTLSGDDFKLACALLLLANWQDKKWLDRYQGKEITIKRGQFITSQANLSTESGLTVKKVRNGLDRLEKIDFIEKRAKERSKQFTLISIINYNTYQDLVCEAGQDMGAGRAQDGRRTGAGRATTKQGNQGTKEPFNQEEDIELPPDKPVVPDDSIPRQFFDFVRETKPDYPNKDFPRYAKDTKSALSQYGLEKLKDFWKKYLGITGFFFDKSGGNETKSLRVFFGHLSEIISFQPLLDSRRIPGEESISDLLKERERNQKHGT
jgi:hypothetical protein